MPRRKYDRDYDKYSSLELEYYGRHSGRRYENYDAEYERGTSEISSGRSDANATDAATSGENSLEKSRSKTASS